MLKCFIHHLKMTHPVNWSIHDSPAACDAKLLEGWRNIRMPSLVSRPPYPMLGAMFQEHMGYKNQIATKSREELLFMLESLLNNSNNMALAGQYHCTAEWFKTQVCTWYVRRRLQALRLETNTTISLAEEIVSNSSQPSTSRRGTLMECYVTRKNSDLCRSDDQKNNILIDIAQTKKLLAQANNSMHQLYQARRIGDEQKTQFVALLTNAKSNLSEMATIVNHVKTKVEPCVDDSLSDS